MHVRGCMSRLGSSLLQRNLHGQIARLLYQYILSVAIRVRCYKLDCEMQELIKWQGPKNKTSHDYRLVQRGLYWRHPSTNLYISHSSCYTCPTFSSLILTSAFLRVSAFDISRKQQDFMIELQILGIKTILANRLLERKKTSLVQPALDLTPSPALKPSTNKS